VVWYGYNFSIQCCHHYRHLEASLFKTAEPHAPNIQLPKKHLYCVAPTESQTQVSLGQAVPAHKILSGAVAMHDKSGLLKIRCRHGTKKKKEKMESKQCNQNLQDYSPNTGGSSR